MEWFGPKRFRRNKQVDEVIKLAWIFFTPMGLSNLGQGEIVSRSLLYDILCILIVCVYDNFNSWNNN